MRKRNPAAISAMLIVLATVNLMGIFNSPRWAQIHNLDAVRLVVAGMLIGVALAALIRQFREKGQKIA